MDKRPEIKRKLCKLVKKFNRLHQVELKIEKEIRDLRAEYEAIDRVMAKQKVRIVEERRKSKSNDIELIMKMDEDQLIELVQKLKGLVK